MAQEKSLALFLGRSSGLAKIVGFIGLITLASGVNSEDAVGEPVYAILCISECPTCPGICSPPPPSPSSPSSKSFPSPPTPAAPASPVYHSPPLYFYTHPPPPPLSSSPPPAASPPPTQAPDIYPIWGAPPPPMPLPPPPPPPSPYKYNKTPPSMPYSPIIEAHNVTSSPFYYFYASNSAFESSLPAHLCTVLLLDVLFFLSF